MTTLPTLPALPTLSGRVGRAALAALVAGSALLAAPATATTALASADDLCATVDSERPVGVYTGTAVEDPGVAVYVGGDLSVRTATEIEGRVVVGGDADLTATSTLDVGTAGGGGSAITPAGGADMLVVGGDLANGPGTRVGFHSSGGGNVVVGGVIRGAAPTTESFGSRGSSGTVTQQVGREAALAPYTEVPGLVEAIAADASRDARPVTPTDGILRLDGAGRYTLTAEAAADLRELDVRTSGAVRITVTGADVSIRSLQDVRIDGVRVFQSTQHRSARLLWSFPEATHVTLGTNDQFPGTLVVPRTDSRLTLATSTNGRILARGDVGYTGGAGIEHHNYPFLGDCTSAPLVDEPAPPVAEPEQPEATDAPTQDVATPPTEVVPPVDEPTTGDDEPAATTGGPTSGSGTSLDGTPDGAAATGTTAADGADAQPRTPLATTGASSSLLAGLAVLLLAAGVAVLLVARRRAAR